MAYTESKMIDLGTLAPDFLLPDTVTGSKLNWSDIRGKQGTVVMFICNHCPYVIHVNQELINIASEYLNKGVGFVAISSNDAEKYPADGPENMKEVAETLRYPFPYLYDESQEVARSFDAACTPDIYLFDGSDRLCYRGRLDDSRPGNDVPLTGKDLKMALNQMLSSLPPLEKQYPGAGCNIKWKI